MRQKTLLGLIVAGGLTAPADAFAVQAIQYSPQEIAAGVLLFEPNDPGLGNVVAIVSGEEALVVDARCLIWPQG